MLCGMERTPVTLKQVYKMNRAVMPTCRILGSLFTSVANSTSMVRREPSRQDRIMSSHSKPAAVARGTLSTPATEMSLRLRAS